MGGFKDGEKEYGIRIDGIVVESRREEGGGWRVVYFSVYWFIV